MFEALNTARRNPDSDISAASDAETPTLAAIPIETTTISWEHLASRLTQNEFAILKNCCSEPAIQPRDIFDELHRSVDHAERIHVDGAKSTRFEDFFFEDEFEEVLSHNPLHPESVPEVVDELLMSSLGVSWLEALGYKKAPSMDARMLMELVVKASPGFEAPESQLPEEERITNSSITWDTFSDYFREKKFSFKRATLDQIKIPDQYRTVDVCAVYRRSREMVDKAASVVDKVSNRRLAEEIGILLQPRYLDTRDYNRAAPFLIYSNLDLSGIDTSEILNHDSSKPCIWIFENLHAGFGIIHDHDKWCVVSFNPVILKVIRQQNLLTPSTDLAESQLNNFLSEIQRLPNICMRILEPAESNDAKTAASLASLVASHDQGAIYVKSTRTAGGSLVSKVQRNSEGGIVLRSNDHDLKDCFEKRLDIFKRRIAFDEPEVLIKNEARFLFPQTILTTWIQRMEAPVIEEEIRMAPCGDGRAEGRFIYQLEAGRLVRNGAYCKYSPNDVAANISLGGTGISLEAAFSQILSPLVSTEDLSNAVTYSLNQVFERVDAFAQQWFVRDPAEPSEFAVDVAFAWNEEARELDFYLIEIQRGFAFSGLWSADPTAAQAVQANRISRLPSRWAFLKQAFSADMGIE